MSRAGRAGHRFLRVLPEGRPYTGYQTRGFSLAETRAGMSVFPNGRGSSALITITYVLVVVGALGYSGYQPVVYG